MTRLLCLCFVLILLAQDLMQAEANITGKDGCLHAIEENKWQRSVSFKASVSAPKFSDNRLIKGWYKFTSPAGGEIPTQCPGPYSCGTHGSTWIKGTLPTQDHAVSNMTACVAWDNSCCRVGIGYNWNVPVMKCPGGYYVYYLTPTPGAGIAYCAGTESPCPRGSTSATGFTPKCQDSYPRIKGTPKITVEVDNKQLQFRCTFETLKVQTTARFKVEFWSGSPAQILEVVNLKGAERLATMKNDPTQTFPIFNLGTTFSCRITTHYDYSPKDKSAPLESNLFFAGIKVEPRQIQFRLTEKDKPMKLKLTSTVPIVCKKLADCKVSVDVGQVNTQTIFDYCTVVFKASSVPQTQTLEVVAKRDFVDDGDHTMNVQFKVQRHLDPEDWDQHLKIPDAQIMAVDISTATCTSSGDPHIKTFDKFYYNHFSVGDYVLAKSKNRKFEVHVRTWKCARVSCNCGIAVREGDDTAIIDMCRGGIPRVVFPSEHEPQPGFKVTRSNNGKSFLITLPSGAFVKFSAYKWFAHWHYANFVVQVPSDDFDGTEGLCGTFDKNIGNEMRAKGGVLHSRLLSGRVAPHAFTESWRLPVGGSMFYWRYSHKKKCTAKRIKHYCTCLDNNAGTRHVNCDFKGWAQRPKYQQGTQQWKGLTFPGAEHCGKRRRRSTDDSIILPDDDDLNAYTFDPDQNLNITIPTFPTAAGKTEAATRTFCKDQLENSDVGKICLALPGFEVKEYLEQCVEDILFSDNNTFALSSIATLQDDCEELALRNMTLWKKDPEKNNTIAPPVAVGNTLCPNMCSNNGKCENGTCICSKGFVPPDCSLLVNQGPTVESIPGSGLCDIRKRECIRTRVVGDDFIDTDKLTCRAQAIKISDKPYEKTSNLKVSRAFMLSFREAMCEFSVSPLLINGASNSIRGVPAAGYLIDISNDGVLYSANKAVFLVYDSKCLDCIGAKVGTCKHKAGTCNINGYCFAKDEHNPDDWCETCQPGESESAFTKRKVHQAPVFKMSNKLSGFVDQEMRIQLNAYDPENQTVTFRLGERKAGCTLSKTGLLVSGLLGKETTYVDVIAADGCGKETKLTLEIEAKHCACKNGGQCNKDTDGKTFCKCRPGCTGLECESAIQGETCKSPTSESSKLSKTKMMTIIILAVVLGVLALIVVAVLVVRWKKAKAVREIESKLHEVATPKSKRGMENKAYSMNQLQDD